MCALSIDVNKLIFRIARIYQLSMILIVGQMSWLPSATLNLTFSAQVGSHVLVDPDVPDMIVEVFVGSLIMLRSQGFIL